jgi:hypothetical protein
MSSTTYGPFPYPDEPCTPQACAEIIGGNVGREHFDAMQAQPYATPTASVVALVVVLGLACLVLSIPTRRNGRRVTYRKGHK